MRFFENRGALLRRTAATLLLLCTVALAHAHKSSDAYLQFSRAETGGGVRLRWDIALRDLEVAVAIDANRDGVLKWGEIRRALPAIDAYALPRLQWPTGCSSRVVDHALERRSDGAYVVLNIVADCPLTADFAVGYRLFAEVDPTHRGIATFDRGAGATQVRMLDPTQARDTASGALAPSGAGSPAQPASGHASFVQEGLRHIVGGYDHVLFLVCLLLPAVVRRVPGSGWRPVANAREGLAPILAVVTLFTLAHSITLALAALDLVSLSPRIIEPAIAATIALAALDNLVPVFGRGRYAVTFTFGLIHGFGFAGALKEVSLPPAEFAWALLRFNLGIEAGQLAIVALVVPVLLAVRRWRGYPRWILQAGSCAALILALVWLAERVFDVALFPFSV